MKNLTYTETTLHGPEVDFGTGWTHNGEGYLRVTWVEYLNPTEGFTGRGDVKAFKGNTEVAFLGRDIPLFVVEHVLSQPIGSGSEAGWADACMGRKDVSWVEQRLARYNGCQVVTYNGKERYNGEVKAARAYAEAWGFEARQGGWIYTRSGRAFTQGWRSFSADLKASRVIVPIRQEETGTDYKSRRYSETWVVSVTRSTFGA